MKGSATAQRKVKFAVVARRARNDKKVVAANAQKSVGAHYMKRVDANDNVGNALKVAPSAAAKPRVIVAKVRRLVVGTQFAALRVGVPQVYVRVNALV